MVGSIVSLAHHSACSRVNIIGWTHGCVTCIRSRQPNHSINVFLNVLNKSLDHVDLCGAWANEHLNSMIDFLFVLARTSQLQEFLLLGPLSCLSGDLSGPSINLSPISTTYSAAILHISIWHWDTMISRVRCSLTGKLLESWILLSFKYWVRLVRVSLCFFLLLLLSFLFLNQLSYKFFLVDLILNLSRILVTLFFHDKDGLMISIFYKFVFDVLIHHVEPIFNVVFGSSGHLFYDLWPLVPYGKSFFKNKDIFAKTEGIFLDLRVEEVDPPLPTLLAVPGDTKASIELVSDLRPLLCTILTDQFHELLVFSFDPVTLLYGWLLVLVELVLALRIISSWDEPSDLDPVILVEFLWSDALPSAVLLDRPLKKVGFVICPVFFGVVSFFTL